MKKYTLILCLLSASLAFGQTDTGLLKGKVTDSDDGHPLPGAHVFIAEKSKGSTTNFDGEFKIAGLPDGSYTVTVSYIGYGRAEKEITVSEGKTEEISFSLTPRMYQAGEAVITGSRVTVTRNDLPLSVSAIPQREIERSEESNIMPVISQRVPGVFVTERGVTGFGVSTGSAGEINIRGIGGSPNTNVLVLIDGHPQYMGIFGHPLPDSYVASDAEQVEVVRGPASILYGSNAMGGVINIITKNQLTDGFRAFADVSYGSYDTRKYNAGLGYKKGKFNIYGSFNHDQTDGHRDNSSFRIDNGYLKAGYDISKNFRLTIDGSLAKSKAYDPGPAREVDSSYILQEHWVDILRGKVSASLNNSFNRFEGAVKFFYNFGEHDIYDGFHSLDHNYGLMIYETYRVSPSADITMGFDYKNYGGMAENLLAMGGEGVVFADTAVYEMGGYLMYQQKFLRMLTLNAGVRLDHHKMFGQEWIPQAGLVISPEETMAIKLNVSKGYRSPTIRELFLFAPANPELQPERMWNYEASFAKKFFGGRLRAEITGFYAKGDNLIETTGVFPEVINKNTGEFTHYGIEFEGKYNISDNLDLNANYSWLHMEKPVAAAPEHQVFAEANYRVKKFTFTVNGMHVQDLYTRTFPTGETQTYTLLNAKVRFEVHRMVTLYIAGNNLLDKKYEINYDYPMPGITFFGGVKFRFHPLKELK